MLLFNATEERTHEHRRNVYAQDNTHGNNWKVICRMEGQLVRRDQKSVHWYSLSLSHGKWYLSNATSAKQNKMAD